MEAHPDRGGTSIQLMQLLEAKDAVDEVLAQKALALAQKPEGLATPETRQGQQQNAKDAAKKLNDAIVTIAISRIARREQQAWTISVIVAVFTLGLKTLPFLSSNYYTNFLAWYLGALAFTLGAWAAMLHLRLRRAKMSVRQVLETLDDITTCAQVLQDILKLGGHATLSQTFSRRNVEEGVRHWMNFDYKPRFGDLPFGFSVRPPDTLQDLAAVAGPARFAQLLLEKSVESGLTQLKISRGADGVCVTYSIAV